VVLRSVCIVASIRAKIHVWLNGLQGQTPELPCTQGIREGKSGNKDKLTFALFRPQCAFFYHTAQMIATAYISYQQSAPPNLVLSRDPLSLACFADCLSCESRLGLGTCVHEPCSIVHSASIRKMVHRVFTRPCVRPPRPVSHHTTYTCS
jgi:hypothetical protein